MSTAFAPRCCPSRKPRLIVCVLLLAALPCTGCDALLALLAGPTPQSIGLQLVAEGLTSPVGLVHAGDGSGRLFVIDQIGLIRVIDANGNLLDTPFLDLRDRMVTVGIDFGGGLIFDERGLLGLAFHPNYAANGKFYVFYTAPRASDGVPLTFNSETHVSEFLVSAGDANVADPDSERVLLVIGKPQFNHNGGQLAFGPDGYLYIAVGDGGGANDAGEGHNPDIGNGQDLATLLGKILRIDVNSGNPYGIPPTNPFINTDGALPEIFAMGMRNPWRFSFNAGGAQELFVADVGQNLVEEVNIVTAGGNYGWRVREGTQCFNPDDAGSPPASCATADNAGRPLLDPIVEYPHTDPADGPRGIAVIGGYVYRGQTVPGLFGRYVFGDFSRDFGAPDGSLFAAQRQDNGTWQMSEFMIDGGDGGRLGRYLFGMGQDPDGEVYVLTSANLGPVGTTGQVHRIVPVAP
ncbi:Quinoprotein glucose dehydrogenase B precursor [Phycisphaerae bacterium RAS2]|nr:Quinoprotein glucose dehydrogenase B precursor [Phycisphaerae bacterium RAS2]